MGRRRLIGVVTVALLSGCSSSARTTEPAASLTQAWRTTVVTPIGQPVAVDGTVVVYGTLNNALILYGISAQDGAVRWQQPASPGAVVGGIAVHPTVLDGRIVYFRPDRSATLAARLVVAAPADGHDLLVSAPGQFESHPSRCPDDKDICVRAYGPAGTSTWRFSVEAGGLVPDRGGNPPANARFVGENLLDLGQRHPEVLAGFENGAVRWQAPLSRYFPDGYTTDQSWFFERYASAGLAVGSVGRPADGREGTRVLVDLGQAETVAINTATGALAWRADGTRMACDARIQVSHTLADGRSELWPVRCRSRGIERFDQKLQAATFSGLDVTVEGFDVRTGTTTWSVPLGAAEAFLREGADATAVSDTEVLVQGATGAIIVDVATGATRLPASGETYWCGVDSHFHYRESRNPAASPNGDDWRGGTLLNPCTADGSATTVIPQRIPHDLGATVGNRTVIADAYGLTAYDRAGR